MGDDIGGGGSQYLFPFVRKVSRNAEMDKDGASVLVWFIHSWERSTELCIGLDDAAVCCEGHAATSHRHSGKGLQRETGVKW